MTGKEIKTAEEILNKWLDQSFEPAPLHFDTIGKILEAMEEYKSKWDSKGEENWINVEDKKPEDGIQIVVTNGNSFNEIVYWDKESSRYLKPFRYDDADLAAFHTGDFTHWMPLPKPPKK